MKTIIKKLGAMFHALPEFIQGPLMLLLMIGGGGLLAWIIVHLVELVIHLIDSNISFASGFGLLEYGFMGFGISTLILICSKKKTNDQKT